MDAILTHIDLKPGNLGAIRSLIMTEARRLMREESLPQGRAMVKATDWAAHERVNPAMSGDGLARWIALCMAELSKQKRSGNGRPEQSALLPENGWQDDVWKEQVIKKPKVPKKAIVLANELKDWPLEKCRSRVVPSHAALKDFQRTKSQAQRILNNNGTSCKFRSKSRLLPDGTYLVKLMRTA